MGTLKGHWTSRSTDDFVYRIAADFVLQIENKMDSEHMKQAELANILNVTDGRVSQVLRNPGNLTLKKVVEYSRALGMKAAIVAYDDGDRENENGPINSEIFNLCWQRAGAPKDFFILTNVTCEVPIVAIDWVSHLTLERSSGTPSDWNPVFSPCGYKKVVTSKNSVKPEKATHA